MKIGFDLRSLSSGNVSGVENYCVGLLNNLLQADRQNQYLLFSNSFKSSKSNLAVGDFNYVNSQKRSSQIPSRLLNLAFKLNLKKIEDFTGDLDWFFMPNLNQFSLHPKTKLAITVHDLSPVITPEFYDIKRSIWHKFLNYKKAFDRANVLFAVSEYTKNDLIKIFQIDPKKIVVAYPAVSVAENQSNLNEEALRKIRNFYGLPGEYFLFLNTIEPRKNLGGLIKAYEKLNTSASLIIAGRLGWKYKKDFQLIRQSQKSAKIKYIGYVEEQYKPALIKMAKALVYPSFYEGFGFQALEAMALKTPVIASQLTSLPEVIGSGGLIVNPYDPNSIAAGMNNILNDEALKKMLIKNGEERSIQFDWKKTASIILENLNK